MISRSAELFDQHDLEDRVREIFHEIDTNDDGMIDEEELTNALEKLCFTASELSNDSNKRRILSEFAKIDECGERTPQGTSSASLIALVGTSKSSP